MPFLEGKKSQKHNFQNLGFYDENCQQSLIIRKFLFCAMNFSRYNKSYTKNSQFEN